MGRGRGLWLRRGLIVVLLAVPALALANVFGQSPSTSTAKSSNAILTVKAPSAVRSGLLYEARFTINAPLGLKDAHLVLSSGWLEGMTVNTIEPSSSNETSANGSLQLSLGSIPAGHLYALFIQFQVDPTTAGSRSQDVALFNGNTRLIDVHRSLTVFP